MQAVKMLSLVAIICGGLSLASLGQKKPRSQRQPPAQANPQEAERNTVPVRQLYEEMFSQGRYELKDQVFAKRCPVHFGGRNVTLEQAVAEGKGWRSAAPDLTMTIDEIAVNDDMVTAAWTARGTHTGQGHGLKPTGRRILIRGNSQFRVVNGKIVEAWNEEYRPELFRQLGVSRTTAFILVTADSLWADISQMLPDRLYASLE